jgi:hypothetical protein
MGEDKVAKYEELSEQLSDIYDERDDLEKSTKHFGIELIKGLIIYLDYEPDKLTFSKPDPDCSDSMMLWESIELQPDNYWHFNIQMKIEHKDKMKWLSMCYDLGIKPKGNKFILGMFNIDGNINKEFLIDLNNEEERTAFYDHMYSLLKEGVTDFKYPIE